MICYSLCKTSDRFYTYERFSPINYWNSYIIPFEECFVHNALIREWRNLLCSTPFSVNGNKNPSTCSILQKSPIPEKNSLLLEKEITREKKDNFSSETPIGTENHTIQLNGNSCTAEPKSDIPRSAVGVEAGTITLDRPSPSGISKRSVVADATPEEVDQSNKKLKSTDEGHEEEGVSVLLSNKHKKFKEKKKKSKKSKKDKEATKGPLTDFSGDVLSPSRSSLEMGSASKKKGHGHRSSSSLDAVQKESASSPLPEKKLSGARKASSEASNQLKEKTTKQEAGDSGHDSDSAMVGALLDLVTSSKKTALPPLANANVNKSVPEARKKRSYKKKQATVDGPLLAQNIASDNKENRISYTLLNKQPTQMEEAIQSLVSLSQTTTSAALHEVTPKQ
ncbi:uncharacterized protein LOC135146103 [Zophobas morio]|uniref:uncharacterized protein LOC135146103 n=1 Tax=Zophobas morio TaxID=2755281 RepID=UPI003082F91E